jgi:hypothetical protein
MRQHLKRINGGLDAFQTMARTTRWLRLPEVYDKCLLLSEYPTARVLNRRAVM